MVEVIPSKWMREYLRDHNRELSEWEKAAVLLHVPNVTWNTKLDSLQKLSDEVHDPRLKKQMLDKITSEKENLEKFRENPQGNYVYLVNDNSWELYGCFSDYETAYTFTLSCYDDYCDDKQYFDDKHYNCPLIQYFVISKYRVYGNGQLDTVSNIAGSLTLSSSGEIISFCSYEGEDFEENGEERFEEHFFRIPCGMDVGIVKVVGSTEYGVVDTTKELWEKYLSSLSGSGWEFDDIQVTVRYLTEDGIWTHEHINPLYLEPELPVFTECDRVGSAWMAAADTLIKYLNEMTADNAAAVVDTAKKYAEECRKQKIADINRIEDILH